MIDQDKLLYLSVNSTFVKNQMPTEAGDIPSIMISGYASTSDLDRQGDVVPPSVWEKGMQNYLRNPVILAYHDHDKPVGRMIEHRVDQKGLWIKARISSVAENVFNLVRDGLLTAFSIGFRIKDAAYDQESEIFTVNELELHEISVVSIPANQNTLFSLSKAFDSIDKYESFKLQFAPKSESAKGLESSTEAESTSIISKEWNMSPEEIKQMMADAAKQASEDTAKAIISAQEKAVADKAAAAKLEADLEARIKAAVAAAAPKIETVDTGAEKLLAEVEKRFEAQATESKKALEGLEAALKEKAAELEAVQRSKMTFADKNNAEGISFADKETAVMLSKISGKSLADTKFGRDLIEKAAATHSTRLPELKWELEVSMRMEEEVRRRLVVAPTLRNIAMQSNVMAIPVNPETGLAQWVTNAQFGAVPATLGTAGASAGNTETHAIGEIILNTFKLATNEYISYELEEDSMIAMAPLIRDAMIRRMSRAADRSFLRGTGANGLDPVKGLAAYAGTGQTSAAADSNTTSSVALDISDILAPATNPAAKATVAKLRTMRRDLGAWGLDPSELIYIVSTEVYYDLLDDDTFQTMDKVGPQATLLTGQIGVIANTPVLVSAEFADRADGAVAAICFHPGNFLVGNQRGLRMDTQDLVETQRKVMVASLRTGMVRVTKNLGNAVTKMTYVA